MNFMPMPEEMPEFVPEDMNGGPPEPEDKAGPIVEALGQAIKVSAEQASASTQPDAVKDFGQAAFYFAQALEKLMPQKPHPDAQLREEAAVVKHAATLGSQEERQTEKLEAEQVRDARKAEDGGSESQSGRS